MGSIFNIWKKKSQRENRSRMSRITQWNPHVAPSTAQCWDGLVEETLVIVIQHRAFKSEKGGREGKKKKKGKDQLNCTAISLQGNVCRSHRM